MTKVPEILCATALLLLTSLRLAAEPNLVPAVRSTAPDYFCTWNVQGFACGYSGASDQADMMVEANLFGTGATQNWTGFYPAVRGDLTFLLDDACDFPIGGGHRSPVRGSVELDAGRFPSFQGTPVERLTKLTNAVKARGWRDLGLWICNSRNRLPGKEQIDNDAYWSERLAWSQAAGIRSWKVDWGVGDRDKPLWKFAVTPRGRSVAPDVWIEFGRWGDMYRTYDVGLPVSISETVRRIGVFLQSDDAQDHRLINCEDEVYVGAALGCSYGVMRHPLTGNMPNGKPDGFFPANFRDVKRRMDEVTRAVRWHRIAQPFGKGDACAVDAAMLTDYKARPAPARIARGGLKLPKVAVPGGGGDVPFVLASHFPTGQVAIATQPRRLEVDGKPQLVYPLADVVLEAGDLKRAVGVFGQYASLTLVTTGDLSGKHILAQDLAGSEAVDITEQVSVEPGRVTIPGDVIARVGLMAATPGDVSDPGMLVAVQGVTQFPPLPDMHPGKTSAAK
ncbi:MAG TPA: hypothetical protein VLJ39_02470 [Tepidisphaeraceae bacterium]|nr:hypothetical protein [Tepidisphaeraceae bacterium]